MINNYKKFNLKEITKENFSKEIPKVLELQEKVKESLKKLWKGDELFFTNTYEEFLKEVAYEPSKFIWIYNSKNDLCGYWLINKHMEYYRNKMIDLFIEDISAQIDIIVIDPDLWWKKLGSYILKNLENKYIELVPSTTTFLATVSPYNISSLKLFIKNWYYINGLFKKHNKYYRVIVRKDLNINPNLKKKEKKL